MAASETLRTEQPNTAADGNKGGRGQPWMAASETLSSEQPNMAADGNKRAINGA